MATFRCEVAIPTRELFSGVIHYASVPSAEGSYGVLPGHEMLVASNNQGILTLWLDEAGNDRREFLLYEGASHVYNNVLTVLGRFGVEISKIDVKEVQEKAEAMRHTIEELEQDGSEAAEAKLKTSRKRLAWYELQLKTAENTAN